MSLHGVDRVLSCVTINSYGFAPWKHALAHLEILQYLGCSMLGGPPWTFEMSKAMIQ